MKTLGQILLEREWITRHQLERAIKRQEQLGGRLGTSLLEIEAISEDLLIRTLSEQLGVPSADLEDLRGLAEEVSGLLPANMAVRSEAIPFRIVGGNVDIAMLEVRDLALQDELSFIIGKPLRIHIANEARVFEALEMYYGRPCPVRFRHLVDRLNRSRDRWRSGEPAPTAPAPRPAPAPVVSVEAAPAVEDRAARRKLTVPPPPVTQRKIPLSEAERAALGKRVRTGTAAAPSTPATVAAAVEGSAVAALGRATTPAEVGDVLLAALSQQFVRTLLFRVSKGQVRGWQSRVPGLDTRRFEEFTTPLGEPSVFQSVERSRSMVVGPLPPGPPHDTLLDLWNGEPGTECLVCPISVRGKLVGVILGDRDALGVTGVDLTSVRELARRAGEALERCIMRRKQSGL